MTLPISQLGKVSLVEIASRPGFGPDEEEARATLRYRLYGWHQLELNPQLNEGQYYTPDPLDTGPEDERLCTHCVAPLLDHELAKCPVLL